MKNNMFMIEFTLPGADKTSRIYVYSVRQRNLVLEMLSSKQVYMVHVSHYKRASSISCYYFGGKLHQEYHHKSGKYFRWDFPILMQLYPPVIHTAA